MALCWDTCRPTSSNDDSPSTSTTPWRAPAFCRATIVELIEGEILTMTPIGPAHAVAVDRAAHSLMLEVRERAVVRVRGPIRLDDHSEPEPDISHAIVEYWLVDLAAGVVTCYSSPEGSTYREKVTRTRGEWLAPALLPECTIGVDDLL
jgi:Uma2 family endonuclease